MGICTLRGRLAFLEPNVLQLGDPVEAVVELPASAKETP